MRSLYAERVRPRHAVIGALALGSTLSVTALAIAQGPPASSDWRLAPPPAPSVLDERVRFGQPVVLRGRLGAEAAGAQLAVQASSPGRRWHIIATTPVRTDGTYRVAVRLRTSSVLRVAPYAAHDETGQVVGGAVATLSSEERPSAPRRVKVAARVVTSHRDRDVTAGTPFHVRGTVLPRSSGRRIVVEAGTNGKWHPVARTRTRAHGHFDTRVVASQLGTSRLRVRFAGDRRNVSARVGAGTLQAFRPALASWYALYGNRTACGQTLGYETLGVANKSLPCGTMVTLRYQGREITVPVIDRGPYVGGREWDLTGATARALGFSGAGVVWSTR